MTPRRRRASDLESFIGRELHKILFLEEFVFSRNKFVSPASGELELADAVVMLGDVLLIFQIKERLIDGKVDASAEKKWFDGKVLGKATRQVRDTLRYLQSFPEIFVPNERGHMFNLAANSFAEIIKIVIYFPSPKLPTECRHIHHHVSETGGFIHIMDAHDYVQLSQILRVPQEVIEYFRLRERVLTEFKNECSDLSESALAGHFIGERDNKTPPNKNSISFLHRLVDDRESWDIAPLLRGLHENLSGSSESTKYYAILLEFMKLPRSAWRIVKERIMLCHENVLNDQRILPYRFVNRKTDCGFVFIPVHSEFVQNSNWPTIRDTAIENMVRLHKYDQRLSKCVGYLVGKDGNYFDINWGLLSHEWTEDVEVQKILEENFPFRPVREAELFGYYITDE